MLTGTRVLAVIAWTAALVASLGVALIDPWLMATAGIVCAVAATGWGLLAMLRAGRMVREDDRYRAEREAVWERRDATCDIDDMFAMVHDEWDSRPVWPHDAGGIE